ncbi:MAG: zinc ribbon domain-containing protein, partial [Planctomycetota bacterium]
MNRSVLPGARRGLWLLLIAALLISTGDLGAAYADEAGTPPPADAAPHATRCPRCGRLIERGYRFCPFDGSPLPLSSTCRRCGRPLEKGWRFCPWDGTPRTGAPAAPPPAAARRAVSPPAAPTRPEPASATASPTAARGNPLAVIDALYEAIGADNREAIVRLYDWERFLPARKGESAADRKRRIGAYVDRLLSRVKPTLANTRRHVTDIKLRPHAAEIEVLLRSS